MIVIGRMRSPAVALAGLLLLMLGVSFAIATAPLDPDPLAEATTMALGDQGADDRPVVVFAQRTTQGVRNALSMIALLNYLEAKGGIRARIRMVSNVPEFHERLRAGDLDLVILGPLEYVEARERANVEALAASVYGVSGKFYKGMIVSNDSSLSRVEEIRGKRVTFVDPTSASGYLFPLAVALEHGIDPYRDCRLIVPSGSHNDVALNLLQGRFDVGFMGADFPLLDISGESVPLKVLARTVPIPPGVVAASAAFMRRDRATAERLRDLLLEMKDDTDAANVAHYFRAAEGGRAWFDKVVDADYDPVRRVRDTLRRHGRLQ